MRRKFVSVPPGEPPWSPPKKEKEQRKWDNKFVSAPPAEPPWSPPKKEKEQRKYGGKFVSAPPAEPLVGQYHDAVVCLTTQDTP